MRRIAWLLAILLTVISADAQQTPNAELKGAVTDQQGAVISDCNVLLVDLESLEAKRVAPDAQGRFEFRQLHSSHAYQVMLSAPNFTRIVQKLEVRPGENSKEFTLKVATGGGVEVIRPPRQTNEMTASEIHGIAFDDAGAIFARATILLIDLGTLQTQKVLTDTAGGFRFRSIEDRPYMLFAKAKCYRPEVVRIVGIPDISKPLKITLSFGARDCKLIN